MSLFTKSPVKLPNKSGFDMSHSNFFTAKCGTLTPCLVDYLLPNDTVHITVPNMQVQLPPMATDFYGYIYAKVELFFVPNRVLYGGWQDAIAPFITDEPTVNNVSFSNTVLPSFTFTNSVSEEYSGRGTLVDYLNMLGNHTLGNLTNIFPLLSYHKIYDDWYRDSRIQKPVFVHPTPSTEVYANLNVYSLPFIRWGDSPQLVFDNESKHILFDGVSLFSLRQRNWPKDYFTNASLQPQAGEAASVAVADGEFTIASLRAANALQQFLERNNIAGNEYQDRIKAHFGIYPSDAITNRALYLGSFSQPVYTKGVFQTAGGESAGSNPFDSVASKFGSSQAVGGGSLVKSFTTSEHGILMALFSLVPTPTYSTGMARQAFLTDVNDYPYPILAGVGDQELYTKELNRFSKDNTLFGYSQRYSEYKFMKDEVHGLLCDGESLSSFALQRSFQILAAPKLGSKFLQIPSDYLDQVTAVKGDVSKFGCWVDMYFSYKKISTLPAYSIPTLENLPMNGHTEMMDNGGFRL